MDFFFNDGGGSTCTFELKVTELFVKPFFVIAIIPQLTPETKTEVEMSHHDGFPQESNEECMEYISESCPNSELFV